MKILRGIATVLVLGPLVGLFGTVVGMARCFGILAEANTPATSQTLAFNMAFTLYAMAIGLFTLPVGVAIHGIIAHRTRVYNKTTWILMLVMSLLLCLNIPIGTAIGGLTITFLFVSETFRKMRTLNTPDHPIVLMSKEHETTTHQNQRY